MTPVSCSISIGGRASGALVTLFGLIDALFGPIKYGILPDHLRRGESPAGNALIALKAEKN